MSAYREPAEMPVIDALPTPHGLVRANGSRCRCTPPGRLWCWWFQVAPDDRWSCVHGGRWLRMNSYGTGHAWDFWASQRQSKSNDE